MEEERTKRTNGISIGQTSEHLRRLQSDLLVPQFYPDSALFMASLEKMTSEEREMKRNLTKNKATFHVIAPYLRIIHKKYRPLHPKPTETKLQRTTRPTAQKKPFVDFVADISEVAERFEMIVAVHETADALKSLLMANNVVSYFIDKTKNEIFQSPRYVSNSTTNLARKIESGTTMAAYAAFTKTYVVSDNVLADARFPEALGFPGSLTKFAMCVPIKLPDDNNSVVAVYETTRDVYSTPFDNRELQLVLVITGWMGHAILENNWYTSLLRKHELSKYLIYLTHCYHSGNVDVDKTLSDLVIFARDTIGAERGSLYVVEKETKTTVTTEEYDQISETSVLKRQTKKLIEQDKSPLSTVMFAKKLVNNRYKTSSITSEVCQESARSLLCVPILENGRILGALQLTNKKTAAEFTNEDEEILQRFAVYCTMNLLHLKVHDRINRATFQANIYQEMLFYHMRPCIRDEEGTKQPLVIFPTDFLSFAWYPSSDDMPRLVELTLSLFHKVLGDAFMTTNDVASFVLSVKKTYRPIPYHNFQHAFCVIHTMANTLVRCQGHFTGGECAALLIAALCHDLDHRGLSNIFLQLTDHYLATLYDGSPLENHHFAVTKIILHQCKMFKHLKPHSYKELLRDIYECTLATDLNNYFKNKHELMDAVQQQNFSFQNPIQKRLVKNIMMTACDVSDLIKPILFSKRITENMYEELYRQGSLLVKMGLEPFPMMDRERSDMVAENQLQLLTVVVLPCLETLQCLLSSTSPLVSQCKALLRQWTELIEVKNIDTWKPEESYVK